MKFTFSINSSIAKPPHSPLTGGSVPPPDKVVRGLKRGLYTLYGFLIGLQSTHGLPVGIFWGLPLGLVRVSEDNHCFTNTGIVPMVAG